MSAVGSRSFAAPYGTGLLGRTPVPGRSPPAALQYRLVGDADHTKRYRPRLPVLFRGILGHAVDMSPENGKFGADLQEAGAAGQAVGARRPSRRSSPTGMP